MASPEDQRFYTFLDGVMAALIRERHIVREAYLTKENYEEDLLELRKEAIEITRTAIERGI